MAKLFPAFIDIKGKKCVVVGGGRVAERKIKTLLHYGARITLISPEINENIRKIVEKGQIEYIKK
ncbi:MAG: precorrin-2 dehydrogenase/sirohydrochlorin ferrochelatase family protein, partial [Thermodesulfovibrio sp.]